MTLARRLPAEAPQFKPDSAPAGSKSCYEQSLPTTAARRCIERALMLWACARRDARHLASDGELPNIADRARTGERKGFPLTDAERYVSG